MPNDLDRRSFLQRVLGAGVAGGFLLGLLGEAGAAEPVPPTPTPRRTTGITDRDPYDPAGNGRGRRRRRRVGFSDQDRCDPLGLGRQHSRRRRTRC